MLSKQEQLKQKIIKLLHEDKDIYQEIDGFWVFEQTGSGFYSADNLRVIADYLDELNEPWQRQIERDLGDKK